MKLSHLSLAIFSAIALAACGGSSSGDQTTPEQGKDNIDTTTDTNTTDTNTTDTNTTTEQEQEQEKEKEEVAKEDAAIVDPTKDNVVDAIVLSDTSTTASQQYWRSAQSEFDRSANPNEPGSATALSGITLNDQNPNLTNIVIARVQGTNAKDEKVQIAQFAGSNNSVMGTMQDANGDGIPDGAADPNSLQALNRPNALVSTSNSQATYTGGNSFVSYGVGAFTSPLFATDAAALAYAGALNTYIAAQETYNNALEAYKANPADDDGSGTTGDTLAAAINALNTAAAAVPAVPANFSSRYKIRTPATSTYTAATVGSIDGNAATLANAAARGVPLISTASLKKYGGGLYHYSFNNNTVGTVWGNQNGWGDVVDAEGVVTGVSAGVGAEAGPTHGLVGIWSQGAGNNRKSIARGTEENNVRNTRIFGHFYRDPGLNPAGDALDAEAANSWRRPATFITGLDAKNIANQFGLGAEAQTLNNVQYGRVTAVVDGIDLASEAGTTGWNFRRQATTARDNDKLDVADDFYFYRGTNATTIAQMDKLPSDAKIAYEGHALMYGIDNSFHGNGQNLPNAFGATQNYGLGNFVKATLDTGKKSFSGSVYNAWHNQDLKNFTEDTLVEFSGKVTGNTVIGEANRTYVTETRPADFRASFFGANANEVGGAFNSIKSSDPYGQPTWGGVFGAKRVSASDSAWLVSSEKQ